MEPIRVLIADDHLFFRGGVRMLLDSVAETEVVGEASTGEEAVAQATMLQPDVILMDLHMPGLNGIEYFHNVISLFLFLRGRRFTPLFFIRSSLSLVVPHLRMA